MQTLWRDLGYGLWRLIPANPILVRVVYAGGRRTQHAWIRALYLLGLAFVVCGGVIFTHSGSSSPSLADLAKNATQVFKWVSMIQLAMVCILAPIFTAAAITQEKNSQTFNILLSTPLTNAQIVLGSLFSRLYFVFVLLLAGVPLFCIMMVYGGVTGDKIMLALALSACTAVLTGSIAISISVIKVGTGRTIFSFYLAIAVFLLAVYALSQWSTLIPPESRPAPSQFERMSWLAAFHPFLSLEAVLGRTPAPDYGSVAHYGFPFKYWLAYPDYSYIVMTLLASGLMISASLFFVRRGAKEGESTFFRRLFRRDGAGPSEGEARARKPRSVGANPVAWREAATRAGSGTGAFTRYGLLIVGSLLGLIVLISYGRGVFSVAQARLWLTGLVEVELLITLFIATTSAATSMTREKESNTLALLLATPITSSQIIAGKTRGLVRFAAPMLAVPYATVIVFFLFDLIRGRRFSAGPEPIVHGEALITLPLLFLAFTAVTSMWGLKASIDRSKTLGAVFFSGAVVIVVALVATGCAGAIVQTSTSAASAFMPLSPYYAVFAAIDPRQALSQGINTTLTAEELSLCRIVGFVSAIVTVAVWAGLALGLHRSMVRSFDMTIRKQTA